MAEVVINIEENVVTKRAGTETKGKKEEKQEEATPLILGSKKAKISDKIIKVKDVSMDSGKVVILRKNN